MAKYLDRSQNNYSKCKTKGKIGLGSLQECWWFRR